MAIELNDNISTLAPKLLDSRSSLEGRVPYTSIQQANETIHRNFRTRGLMVYVSTPDDLHIYWYKDGIEDENLVKLTLTEPGLELGDTQYTAHRGDHGSHAYNSVVEAEETDFKTQLTSNLEF